MNLLDDYYTEDQLAAELHKTPRTLQRWRERRTGPPVTFLGRVPLYRKEAAREWLRSQERPMARERKRAA